MGEVTCCFIQTNTLIKSFDNDGPASSLALVKADDKTHVWAAGFEKSIVVWDPNTYQTIRILREVHEDVINCLLPFGNGEVVSCSRDKNIKHWEYHTSDRAPTVQEDNNPDMTPAAVEKKFTMLKNGLLVIIDEILLKLKEMQNEIENTMEFSSIRAIAEKIPEVKKVRLLSWFVIFR
eukprot:TRINITY_DN8629_c0_g1_i2.p1 TRINITY_DN8629_c0_g1~~TRINITY_DN8629_c0_g1_i2.p1  ORF type:complete len:178 (-),score=18.93 TRINITY_DN8629_c0_g1_i2:80-613(-)